MNIILEGIIGLLIVAMEIYQSIDTIEANSGFCNSITTYAQHIWHIHR